MKLNQHMPIYQFRVYHETMIDSKAEHVFDIAKNFDFDKLFISRILLGIRSLPGRIFNLWGFSNQKISESPQMNDMGFINLETSPPKELVYGIVGQFWKLKPEMIQIPAREFKDYEIKGHAKAGWNFFIWQAEDDKVKLSTETRVFCEGAYAKFRFRLYWCFIRPFSGLIRREMLYRIKKDAEKLDVNGK